MQAEGLHPDKRFTNRPEIFGKCRFRLVALPQNSRRKRFFLRRLGELLVVGFASR